MIQYNSLPSAKNRLIQVNSINCDAFFTAPHNTYSARETLMWVNPVIASAMFLDVQVPREAGEGETGNRSRGWPGPCRERLQEAGRGFRVLLMPLACVTAGEAWSSCRAESGNGLYETSSPGPGPAGLHPGYTECASQTGKSR